MVKLRVSFSKGTYIRTLCADIGEKLGCMGAMKSLVRSRVGQFRLKEALTLSQIETLKDEDRLSEIILSVESVFQDCPRLHVREDLRKLLDNGNSLWPEQTKEGILYEDGLWVRMCFSDEHFAGIYAYSNQSKQYKPVKMFPENEK